MPRKLKTANGANLGVRIGRNIKAARNKMELTESQLAEAIDVENVTV